MKDQELHDIFHAYRPEIDDNDAFMDQLSAQIDAIDAQRQPRIRPLYRKVLPWAMGIAAAVAVTALVIIKPTTPAEDTSYESQLPAFYYRNMPSSSSHFSDSYDEIVNEIETSGQQLEKAIAQL